MQFVVVLDVSEEHLDGAEDIDHACSVINETLNIANDMAVGGVPSPSVRPLSEVIAS